MVSYAHNKWTRAPRVLSLREIDWLAGAMRLGTYMSRKRFDAILKALSITSHDPPAFRDHFWEICGVLKAWNENMMEQFTPSWANCLDESMSTWTNNYSCPAWMFVPCKPWSFGNEYHTVCCSLSGILWQMEIVEGRMLLCRLFPNSTIKENSWIVALCVGANLW